MADRKDAKWGTMTKEGLIVGRGDNQKVVPPDEVMALAKLHCTYKEMSDFFGINVETLKYNFSDLIAKGRAETKQALRKAQIKLALNGNATMLVWLGKNMLNQSDTGDTTSDENQILPWVENE